MQNIGGTGNAGKVWVAWPPPGPFPMQAYGSGTRSLSTTGWSVQTQRSIARDQHDGHRRVRRSRGH